MTGNGAENLDERRYSDGLIRRTADSVDRLRDQVVEIDKRQAVHLQLTQKNSDDLANAKVDLERLDRRTDALERLADRLEWWLSVSPWLARAMLALALGAMVTGAGASMWEVLAG